MSKQPEQIEQDALKQPPTDTADEVGSLAVQAALPDMNMYHLVSTVGSDRGSREPVSSNYNRGVSDYERLLSPTAESPFNIKDWKHKTILDIGSGAYDRFALEAQAKGVRVISLNPALKELDHRLFLSTGIADAEEKRRERQGIFSIFAKKAVSRSVAGLGQNLPFKDASFDGVVSVFGVPNYLHHVDEEYTAETKEKDHVLISQAFDEIVRVLKPGGKAYLRDRYMPHSDNATINAWNRRNSFSQSDGTEVTEILAALEEAGVKSEVYEDEFGIVDRLIVITKPTTQT